MSETQTLEPELLRKVFDRLCHSTKHTLSRDGSKEDQDLYNLIERFKDPLSLHFQPIGYSVREAEGCFYMTRESESAQKAEDKLEKTLELVLILQFFHNHIEDLCEGTVFYVSDISNRSHEDPLSERFLAECRYCIKQNSINDKVASLVSTMERLGYFQCIDSSKERYRILSGINYLWEILDLIDLKDEPLDEEEASLANANAEEIN